MKIDNVIGWHCGMKQRVAHLLISANGHEHQLCGGRIYNEMRANVATPAPLAVPECKTCLKRAKQYRMVQIVGKLKGIKV